MEILLFRHEIKTTPYLVFYAFDFNSYECSPDEVNGGSGVVPWVNTNPFMYDTLWLVFIKVEIKWPTVKHPSKTLPFCMKFR